MIRALKAMQEGKDPDSLLHTEEIINYFAVHNFLMNYDSYTGMMLHNYYLYDNGKIEMLPWDYNLSYASFPMDGIYGDENDTTLAVNQGIDTPLVCTGAAARPMWNWIISDETYLEQYHRAVDRLIAEQFESGKIAEELDRIYAVIEPYFESGASSFCTLQERENGFEVLKELCRLRASSIRRQLDGKLAKDTGQQNPSDRVDASAISLDDLNSRAN